MIEEEEAENFKNLMIAASLTSFQLGAGKGKSFKSFIKQYGLSEPEEPITEERKKILIEKALENANKIRKTHGIK